MDRRKAAVYRSMRVISDAGSVPMTNNMLNGGQVIVDYLVREGVPYAFGLCGHGNISFIDALYERTADIKTISVHHESVAGFMADVYYRVTGKPVVLLRRKACLFA